MAHVAHAATDGAAQHIPTLTRPQGSNEGDVPPTATASASSGAAVCAAGDSVRKATQACADCALAARRRWHGFRAGCRGCCARAAARSPQFFDARKRGCVTREYRRLLDQFGLSHEDVKAAAAADKAHI